MIIATHLIFQFLLHKHMFYYIYIFEAENPALRKYSFFSNFAYYLDMQPSERVRVHGYGIKIFVFSTGIIVVN